MDTEITEDLKRKGDMRETIRTIQDLRKLANVKFDKLVAIQLPDWPKEYEDEIKTKTYVSRIVRGNEAKLI